MEYNKSQSISRAEVNFPEQNSARAYNKSSQMSFDDIASDQSSDAYSNSDLNTGPEQNAKQNTIAAESIWVSMPNGEQLHMRHLIPHAFDSAINQTIPAIKNKRVFMLHGEVECGRIFYNDSGKGLAYYFAEQGYEVFIADLGGRGRSLTPDTEASTLSVYDIVNEAIPRMLKAINHCPNAYSSDINSSNLDKSAASIWVGHGFGAVLLSAAWARLNAAEQSAQQMIFFGARRQLQAKHRLANAFVKTFCHPLTAKLVNWRNVFPATRMRLGSADENAQWFRVYSQWMNSSEWLDSEDGFDYRAALQNNPIPAALHFAAAADTVFAETGDVRNFIEELGAHDARMIVLDTINGSKRKYDHLSMLMDSAAIDDVFAEAIDWLAIQDYQQQIDMLANNAPLYRGADSLPSNSQQVHSNTAIECHSSSVSAYAAVEETNLEFSFKESDSDDVHAPSSDLTEAVA